ncbi:unnamed protein product [Sympodiomycopsis kandeliae]
MTGSLDLSALRQKYKADGYVIIPSLFSPELDNLRTLTSETIAQTREHRWPFFRKVGKQFPPFDKDDVKDYWGVQHLMHPDLPHYERYQEFYSQAQFLSIAANLMECAEEELQMELFNLLINPTQHYFNLNWHRDDIKSDVDPHSEARILATNPFGIQWNAALYDDECLFIIPGTHKRVRTNEEIIANQHICEPPSLSPRNAEMEWKNVDPKDTLRVKLKAGETCFYSQRLLHRASYDPTRQRATLHGCYGQIGSNGQRARMVLQHDVEYLKQSIYGKQISNPKLKIMWDNLIAEYEGKSKEQFGYSLDG